MRRKSASLDYLFRIPIGRDEPSPAQKLETQKPALPAPTPTTGYAQSIEIKAPAASPAILARRPKKARNLALAEQIIERTENGKLLVDQALGVLKGTATTMVLQKDGNFVEAPPSFKDQAEARCWLSDHAFGRAPETIRVEDNRAPDADEVDLDSLSNQDLVDLHEFLNRFHPAASEIVDAEIIPPEREELPESTGHDPGDAPERDSGDNP